MSIIYFCYNVGFNLSKYDIIESYDYDLKGYKKVKNRISLTNPNEIIYNIVESATDKTTGISYVIDDNTLDKIENELEGYPDKSEKIQIEINGKSAIVYKAKQEFTIDKSQGSNYNDQSNMIGQMKGNGRGVPPDPIKLNPPTQRMVQERYVYLYEDFINESNEAFYNDTMKKILRSEFLKLYEKNVGISFDKLPLIYRGFDSPVKGDYFLFDSSKTKKVRTSAYATNNYYTLLIDNLDSWKEYPKRSKSLICSLDPYKPNSYGRNHVIIPFKNTNVAVCPAGDIWMSFNTIGKLDIFNKNMSSLLSSSNKTKSLGKTAKWDDFYNILKDLNLDDISYLTNLKLLHNNQLFNIIKNDFEQKKSLYDILNKLFDPTDNRFSLIKYTEKFNYNNITSEVWTEGPALAISYVKFLELLNKS